MFYQRDINIGITFFILWSALQSYQKIELVMKKSGSEKKNEALDVDSIIMQIQYI